MNNFIFSYPTKVYFGEGSAKEAFQQELPKMGTRVMLAYGGGSVKKSGVYDELKGMLTQAGKEVVDFSGIMPNPTYEKVQEGAKLAKEQKVDFILAVGGGSVTDCCKVISAQAVTEERQIPYGGNPHGSSGYGIRYRSRNEFRRSDHL